MKTYSEVRANVIPRDMWVQVKVTTAMKAEMIKLREAGWTYTALGEKFNCSPTNARIICLNIKSKPRKRTDYERRRETNKKSFIRRKSVVEDNKGQYTGWFDKRHSCKSVSKWIDPTTEKVYNEWKDGLIECRVLFNREGE